MACLEENKGRYITVPDIAEHLEEENSVALQNQIRKLLYNMEDTGLLHRKRGMDKSTGRADGWKLGGGTIRKRVPMRAFLLDALDRSEAPLSTQGLALRYSKEANEALNSRLVGKIEVALRQLRYAGRVEFLSRDFLWKTRS